MGTARQRSKVKWLTLVVNKKKKSLSRKETLSALRPNYNHPQVPRGGSSALPGHQIDSSKGLVVKNNSLRLEEAFISLRPPFGAVNVKLRARGEIATPA